ncbi:acyl carrier protein [Streptomyces milbemycinicus]|uniref:Phosphopantetheine-binding protein n=1 Tax=Streptomyces milbemycinicus TaxID=476552 RepID=A0ABW8LZP9_9ACTN
MEAAARLDENAVVDRLLARLGDSLLLDVTDRTMDLVDAGVINSSGFMTLFAELEEEFGIGIGAADMRLENFRTLSLIARFVLAKRGAA